MMVADPWSTPADGAPGPAAPVPAPAPNPADPWAVQIPAAPAPVPPPQDLPLPPAPLPPAPLPPAPVPSAPTIPVPPLPDYGIPVPPAPDHYGIPVPPMPAGGIPIPPGGSQPAPGHDVPAPPAPGLSAPAPAQRWALRLPDGTGIAVEGPLLLGRSPSPEAAAGGARLVAVEDPGRTVSRSHLVVEPAGDGLLLRNVSAVNALVLVSADGAEAEVEPGGMIRVTGECRMIVGAYPIGVELAA